MQDFPIFWPESDTETYEDMLTVQRLTVTSSSVDNLKANYDQSEITEKTFKATDLRVSIKSQADKRYLAVPVLALANCSTFSLHIFL